MGSIHKVSFRQMSDIWACRTCGKKIKSNMIIKKLDPPTYCFKCWVERERGRGHLMKRESAGG